MTKRRLTAEEEIVFLHAHEDRLVIINKPFPPFPTIYPRKIWAGCLITHDDDAIFLKGQKTYIAGLYLEEDTTRE